MNKNIFSIMALIGFLASCAGYAPADQPTGALSIAGCDKPAPVICPKVEGDYKVELDLDKWTLKPECITAKKNKVVSVRIKSKNQIEQGTVWVFPKNLENLFWLAKSNDPNKNKIDIKVKGKAPKDKEAPPAIYQYAVWANGKCIDPRVRVIN